MFAGMHFAGAPFAGMVDFGIFLPFYGMEANRVVGWRIQRV